MSWVCWISEVFRLPEKRERPEKVIHPFRVVRVFRGLFFCRPVKRNPKPCEGRRTLRFAWANRFRCQGFRLSRVESHTNRGGVTGTDDGTVRSQDLERRHRAPLVALLIYFQPTQLVGPFLLVQVRHRGCSLTLRSPTSRCPDTYPG
jgi:hypothetical protein